MNIIKIMLTHVTLSSDFIKYKIKNNIIIDSHYNDLGDCFCCNIDLKNPNRVHRFYYYGNGSLTCIMYDKNDNTLDYVMRDDSMSENLVEIMNYLSTMWLTHIGEK